MVDDDGVDDDDGVASVSVWLWVSRFLLLPRFVIANAAVVVATIACDVVALVVVFDDDDLPAVALYKLSPSTVPAAIRFVSFRYC